MVVSVMALRRAWRRWWVGVGLLCAMVAGVRAAEVNVALTLEARGTDVRVTITNQAAAPLRLAAVSVELEGRVYSHAATEVLGAGQKRTIPFRVTWPGQRGTHPIIARITYRNGRDRYSLVHVGEFHVGPPRRIVSPARLTAPFVQKEGTVTLTAPAPERWTLVLPDEIAVVGEAVDGESRTFRVRGQNSDFTNTYPIFAYRQDDAGGFRSLQLVRGDLRMDFRSAKYRRGAIPPRVLPLLILVSGALAFTLLVIVRPERPVGQLLTKTSARYVLLFSGYAFLRELPTLCGVLQQVPWIGRFFDIAKPFTLGPDFRRFFDPQWGLPLGVADLYCAAVLVAAPLYSWFCDRRTSWREDKYAAFVGYLFGVPLRVVRGVQWAAVRSWQGPAKLGFLTCAVKVFFIPLLCAWVIQNTHHMANLTRSLEWQWPVINRYLREACILVDTAVFCVGYLVEATFLRNRIRSVEPTVLGWVVCLWCYPPFNSVSFRPFTSTSANVSIRLDWLQHEIWANVGQALITLSWVIFAWASVALGFKASNLTNRGIVSHGPYRFCRHPAYTVKVLGWAVGALFFAEHGALGLLGLALIYSLRAWTEERHLMRDPDYQTYCRKVRYRFIPGLI